MAIIEVYRVKQVRNTNKKQVASRYNDIIQRLKRLSNQGEIDAYQERKTAGGTPVQRDSTRGGKAKRMTERYDKCIQWARRETLTLGAGFSEKNGYIRVPDLHVIVRRNRNIVGVFPCSEPSGSEGEYTIEDYLTAIENGTDWRDPSSIPPRNLSESEHNALQAHLLDNPKQYFGSNWSHYSTEHTVPSPNTPGGDARIDLVFQRDTAGPHEFFVVEIKPSESEVRDGIGQVLEYRELFTRSRSDPSITSNHVHAAIAAPSFSSVHQTIPKDVGIEAIELP